MSTSIDKLAKELKAQMTASDDRKPKPYDSQAEVLRVEDGIAWVHIPGGVQETPVRLTLNAKKGDIVNIHVANGSAWITGNGTNPPTDDTTANVAKVIAVAADDKSEGALLESSRAKDAADRAEAEVVELEGEVSALDERVDIAEGNITAIEGDITSLGNRVTTAEGNVTTLEGNITTLAGRVDTAETSVNTLEGTVSGLTTRVTTAEGQITTAEGQITTIQGNISTIQGNITSINGAIDSIESDVSGLTTRVGTAEGKVSTAEENITQLETRIGSAENDIDAVEGDINTLQGRVATAEDDIDETLNGLAIAQDVIGTINWITEHGAMTLTSDTQVNPNKVYFEVDPNGIYVVGATHYSIVENPTTSGLSSYYELSVDEAVTNYVASHLALTNEGLYVAKDNSHWKVLVGDNGVYIIDGSSGINKIVASYSSSVVIGQNAALMSRTVINTNGMSVYRKTSNSTDVEIANLGYGTGNTEEGGTAYSPYYTLGERESGSDIGNYSMTEGYRTTASGAYSHAEGNRTTASYLGAHAEGCQTTASGAYSHAEGNGTTADEPSTHAEGNCTIASGVGAHAEGWANSNSYTITASGGGSHAEGYAVYGDILASGLGAHAEGGNTTASDNYAHAEGQGTEASGTRSHAEGVSTTASGPSSHAEGDTTTASNHSAHAEGSQTTASGAYSHSEGIYTVAEGSCSHAEGYYTTASGDYSHAQNSHTTAGYTYQTAIGRYNDNTAGNLFEIGNGTSSLASNAFSVDSTGNVVCAGTVTDSSGRTLLSAETDPTVPSWAKASTKPSYTALEVGAVPTSRTVNGKALSSNITLTTSDLTNDSGYLISETDPTVPSWAKASTKPSYSASEISGLIDMFYPVGSYYETSDTTFNPNTAWGGTWSLETEGQVHISAGSNYSVSGALTDTTDGGEATHTLAKTEIPNFEGSVYIRGYKTSSSSSRAAIAHGGTGIISVGAIGTNTANGILASGGIADLGSNPLTISFGGGQAHNNMQPYIAVNRWHRTA